MKKPSDLSARDRLILAIDTPSFDEACRLIDELSDYVGVFKIGLELFLNTGLAIVDLLLERNLKVFFDGHVKDIPDAVAQESRSLALKGVEMLSVDATGGRAMLEACVAACKSVSAQTGTQAPAIFGLTLLTSLDENALHDELKIPGALSAHVVKLALLCEQCGLDGVVASAAEAAQLRSVLQPRTILATPGIRPEWSATDDQSRITTPSQAIRNGADYLIIGRPITQAANRKVAARRVLEEMEEALLKV